ncbi:MAG: chemotaxis protein CheA [Nitrospinae bacterium]|nr:chemotaxis protein CheA [Nitrospinota bacterium]
MDELEEIIQDFLVETEELIQGVDQDLLDLEKSPDDFELLNKVFRSVHTIKGAAGFLGFNQLVTLVHNTETLLNKLRLGELRINSAISDAVLESIDLVKIILSDIKENKKEKEINLTGILSTLEGLTLGVVVRAETKAPAPKPRPREEVPQKPKEARIEAKEEPVEAPMEQAAEPDFQAPVQREPAASQRPPSQPQQKTIQEKAPASAASKDLSEQTIRVETTKLDHVMNLVGELVLGRNRLTNLLSRFEARRNGNEDLASTLSEVTGFINLVTSDLQLAVMKTRMQPIKKVFGRFPRLVRDLARELNKSVDLILRGEETELDKSVIEQINDPLVHIIRNSIDHGIESKEQRLLLGKPDTGTIRMSAYYEGNHIVIEIEDDGKGIDPARVAAAALKKGVLSQQEIQGMDEKEIINLIFAPGFSTAEKVSDVSGRGVGMDVVKTNITKLSGMIDLVSKVGIGCTLYIKLPLTLAIMNALIVTAGEETFAIALSSVVEITRIKTEEVEFIDQKEVIKLRNAVLPLIRLKDLFDLKDSPASADMIYVVVIGIAEKRIGIVVEKLKGQEEIVIKSMGDYLSEVPGIAGATVGGDGKVMLILDIAAIFEKI